MKQVSGKRGVLFTKMKSPAHPSTLRRRSGLVSLAVVVDLFLS
jgi:hypothetical protein